MISVKKEQCLELIMDIMTAEGTMSFPRKEAENFVDDFFETIEKNCIEIVQEVGPSIGDTWLAHGLAGTCYIYFFAKKHKSKKKIRTSETCTMTDLIALKCGSLLSEGLQWPKERVQVFEAAAAEFEKKLEADEALIGQIAEKFPAAQSLMNSNSTDKQTPSKVGSPNSNVLILLVAVILAIVIIAMANT